MQPSHHQGESDPWPAGEIMGGGRRSIDVGLMSRQMADKNAEWIWKSLPLTLVTSWRGAKFSKLTGNIDKSANWHCVMMVRLNSRLIKPGVH